MSIEFFMPMVPPTVTHQEKKVRVIMRGSKPVPRYYEPAELADARAKLTAHLAAHKPEQPISGPIALMVKWCFPAGNAHQNGEWRITKPDTDNLQKLLKDCMTATGFWRDDAQVCWEICGKFWSSIPGIYISVDGLESTQEDEVE